MECSSRHRSGIERRALRSLHPPYHVTLPLPLPSFPWSPIPVPDPLSPYRARMLPRIACTGREAMHGRGAPGRWPMADDRRGDSWRARLWTGNRSSPWKAHREQRHSGGNVRGVLWNAVGSHLPTIPMVSASGTYEKPAAGSTLSARRRHVALNCSADSTRQGCPPPSFSPTFCLPPQCLGPYLPHRLPFDCSPA